MIADNRRVKMVAGILVLAAILVFTVSDPVFAGFWADLVRGARPAGTVPENGPAKDASVADNPAKCGKCHSSCEYGRSHQGLILSGSAAGNALPLSKEGRTTCLTCHKTHAEGVMVTGDSLQMPNLRRELCLTCHRQELGKEQRIEIVSPLERAVVQEEKVALIGRAEQLAGALLTVRLNGAEFHLHVKEGEIFTWLKLENGINRVELMQGESLLWNGEIYHGDTAVSGNERTSSSHLTDTREQCQGCHKRMGEASVAADETPGLCFKCHDRNNEKRYVHGPLAVGECLVCHDPHSGYGTAHLRREQRLLCGDCHGAHEIMASATCNTMGRGCVECHDPHQSDVKYLLKGPQYTMREVLAR